MVRGFTGRGSGVMNNLVIKNLAVVVEGREVVKDFSIEIKPGEIHALLGPNGSGKSSVAYALAGHPTYEVKQGSAVLGGENLLSLPPEERARKGLFLSFQEPPEVGGVGLSTFLRVISAPETGNGGGKHAVVLPALGLDRSFLSRFLNEGFSGGEKKKSEMLQLLARRPKIAILDEIDTGLDRDALSGVVGLLRQAADEGAGLLLISHALPLFEKLRPDFIHVLLGGMVAASGGAEIIGQLEANGYSPFVISLL